MAKPTTADIEAVYTQAAEGGLTRDQADAIAAPALGASLTGPITSLTGALSNRDLHRAAGAISDEIRHRTPRPPRPATLFQIGEVGRALMARKRANLAPLPGHERFHTAAGTPDRGLITRARLTADEADAILTDLRSA